MKSGLGEGNEMKVLVLGASGMLGEMVCRVLARDRGLDLHAAFRDSRFRAVCERELPAVTLHSIDVLGGPGDDWPSLLPGCSWVINAVGVIKQLIREGVPGDVERAILVNALFPHRLARLTARSETQVLQIATDCVFVGREGRYVESSPHDALDAYGKTKSLGEVLAPHVHHLRCSIIGPDSRKAVSLMEWFLHQPRDAVVKGFTNHW